MSRRATRQGAPGSFVFRVGGLVTIAFSGWSGILRYRAHGNSIAAAFTWPIRLSALSSEVAGLVTVVAKNRSSPEATPAEEGNGTGPMVG